MSLETIPSTIIVDIDGTLIKHYGSLSAQIINQPELLPNVIKKFSEWDKAGCRIILLSGRRESMREETEIQLKSLGLFWDQLVLGATRGKRILINDMKLNSTEHTAEAINLERNKGF